MLSLFSLMLPFSVCLVWVLGVLLRGAKSYPDKLLVAVLLLACIFFFCDANFVSGYAGPRMLVVMDVISQYVTLAFFPMSCIYIRSLTDDTPVHFSAYLLLLPAIFMGTVAVVVYGLLGFGESARLLQVLGPERLELASVDVLHKAQMVICTNAFNLIQLVFMLCSSAYIVFHLISDKFSFSHLLPFLKGQKPSLVSNMVCITFILLFAICASRILLGRSWLISHKGVSSVLSLVMAFSTFIVGYVAFVPQLPGGYMSMERLLHPFEAMRQPRQEYLSSINSGVVASIQVSGYEKLINSFVELMVGNSLFLKPDLTIEELADKLGTNRTYVSKLVNIQYGMPFRDYVNKLRIDYAKRLISDEPDASVDYIAAKSGFNSSSQFIRKFKELENVTPTVWRTRLRR